MTHPDHIALVVPRLEPVLGSIAHLAAEVGPIEEFPSEGTREVYVGNGAAKLLLLEPLSTKGPYARALSWRGPGLHHVAIHVPDLEEFLSTVRGWLMLPASIESIAKSRTAWLARPGIPTLLEVHEAQPVESEPLVSAIELPADVGELTPEAGLTRSPDDRVWLTVRGVRLCARSLALGKL